MQITSQIRLAAKRQGNFMVTFSPSPYYYNWSSAITAMDTLSVNGSADAKNWTAELLLNIDVGVVPLWFLLLSCFVIGVIVGFVFICCGCCIYKSHKCRFLRVDELPSDLRIGLNGEVLYEYQPFPPFDPSEENANSAELIYFRQKPSSSEDHGIKAAEPVENTKESSKSVTLCLSAVTSLPTQMQRSENISKTRKSTSQMLANNQDIPTSLHHSADTPIPHEDTPMPHTDTPMQHNDTPMPHADTPMPHKTKQPTIIKAKRRKPTTELKSHHASHIPRLSHISRISQEATQKTT